MTENEMNTNTETATEETKVEVVEKESFGKKLINGGKKFVSNKWVKRVATVAGVAAVTYVAYKWLGSDTAAEVTNEATEAIAETVIETAENC